MTLLINNVPLMIYIFDILSGMCLHCCVCCVWIKSLCCCEFGEKRL